MSYDNILRLNGAASFASVGQFLINADFSESGEPNRVAVKNFKGWSGLATFVKPASGVKYWADVELVGGEHVRLFAKPHTGVNPTTGEVDTCYILSMKRTPSTAGSPLAGGAA